MTRHTLSLYDRYFDAVVNGVKRFVVRKNDKGYHIGDTLELIRFFEGYGPGEDDSDEFLVKVTYILTHEDFPEGVPDGYVVLGIEKVKE